MARDGQLSLDFSASVTQRQRRAQDRLFTQEFLFVSAVLDLDVSLHNPWEALVNLGGDVDVAKQWMERVVGPLQQLKGRKYLFPASALDRLLHVRPPTKVTLDAACLTVARALWARKLGCGPLVVRKQGRRLLASSPTGPTRWPHGVVVRDAPWTAVACLAHMGVPLDVADAGAAALLAEKVGNSGSYLAEAGVAGSTIYINTSQPDVVEQLGLPALAYAGPVNSGMYRLPVLAAEPLLHEPAIKLTDDARAAIKRLTGDVTPLELDDTFPWKLYPFQARDAAKGLRILETAGGVLLAGDMGSGKCLHTTTIVVTSKGPVRIGDLQVGDDVLGLDGKPYEVKGVYPQGERDLFTVRFTDGREAIADAEHLWQVHSPVMKKRGRAPKVLTTAEIWQGLRDGAGNLRWYVPMVTEALEMDCGFPRPVPPYTRGALLGDGGLSGTAVRFTDAEFEVAANIRAELDESLPGMSIRQVGKSTKEWVINDTLQRPHRLWRGLDVLGVMGKRAWEKSVPYSYLYGPTNVRHAVLQGLLDTDGGTKNTKQTSSVEFCSTSEQLVKDVRWLVESLGGTARISRPRRTSYTHNGEKRQGRPSWRVNVQMPPEFAPFRMPRKANQFSPRTKYQPTRGIESIEPWGRDQAVCISVDSPDHLFLLDGAVATHNTTVSLGIAHHLDLWPCLVAAPLSAFSTWARQLGELNKRYYLASEPTKIAWQRLSDERHELDAVVISYDRLHAFIELLETIEFKAIISDELQKTASPNSRRSRALRHLAQHLPVRIGLSGTPMNNYLADLLPLGSFLIPGEWKPRASSKDLSDLYPGDPVESVAEHLGAMMVRRRIDEVGVQLPDKNMRRVFVQLTVEQRRALDELKAESEREVEEGETERMHVFAKLQRMRQIISSPSVAGVPGPNPKIQMAVELAEEFSAMGRKTVLFAVNRQGWRELGEACDKAGLGWVGVWGSTPVPDRIAAEKRFHADENIRCFIGTVQSCAEAITLSPTGTAAIFTGYVYNPSQAAQAEARIYRLNQTNTCDIIYLHAQAPGGTLDDRFVEILEAKKALISQVVDRREHIDTTEVHYSTGDLVFLLTGKRNEKLDTIEADKKAEAKRAEDKKRHAKASAHKRKYKNDVDVYLDDDGKDLGYDYDKVWGPKEMDDEEMPVPIELGGEDDDVDFDHGDGDDIDIED